MYTGTPKGAKVLPQDSCLVALGQGSMWALGYGKIISRAEYLQRDSPAANASQQAIVSREQRGVSSPLGTQITFHGYLLSVTLQL